MDTRNLVHEWMLVYQKQDDKPPLLREIASHFEQLAYRSSVRYDLVALLDEGKVEEVGDPGTQRRWRAV